MNSSKQNIIFRADGNSQIGLGHIMRCVALAEILKNDFECSFAVVQPNLDLINIIRPYGKVIPLQSGNKEDEKNEMNALLKSDDIVVTDGYNFDADYQIALKAKVHKLIMIDDLAEGFFSADLVVNHGSLHMLNRYDAAATTKVLAGPEYLILRKEFLASTKQSKEANKIDTVFICFGGADPHNITMKVLNACVNSSFLKEINIVIGAAYMYQSDLDQFISQINSKKRITVKKNVSGSELIELINAAELCIVPSSTISLEVCCVRSGILTGITADNQKGIHSQLVETGCAESVISFNDATVSEILGKIEELNSLELINKMIKNQISLIDGKSDERLLSEFKMAVSC